MSKKQLWVMVGCPGAGKDTWIHNHRDYFGKNTKIVSRDDIRFAKVKDGEAYFSKEKEVYKDYVNEICEGLSHYDVTIANATHLNEGARSKLFRSLSGKINPKTVEVNAMFIDSSLDECLEHNENRSGRALVPESAIINMFSSLTIPTIEEGFDNIYIYKGKEDNKGIYEIIKKGDK